MSELLTFTTPNLYTPGYTGPVQILNGAKDFGICGGDCNGWVQPYATKMFPNAKVLEVLEHPGASHGINFHYNATGAFSVMTKFVDEYVA